MGSLFLSVAGVTTLLFAAFDDAESAYYLGALLFLAGPIFFGVTYARYRNRDARHYHERETPVSMDNLQVYDTFVNRLTEQRTAMISGANSQQVNGTLLKRGSSLESMTDTLVSMLPNELGKQVGKIK
jgi:hypothetical protein